MCRHVGECGFTFPSILRGDTRALHNTIFRSKHSLSQHQELQETAWSGVDGVSRASSWRRSPEPHGQTLSHTQGHEAGGGTLSVYQKWGHGEERKKARADPSRTEQAPATSSSRKNVSGAQGVPVTPHVWGAHPRVQTQRKVWTEAPDTEQGCPLGRTGIGGLLIITLRTSRKYFFSIRI